MDLVAGDAPEILLVIGLDDLAALDDRRRFPAHLALGQRARSDLARPVRRGGPRR